MGLPVGMGSWRCSYGFLPAQICRAESPSRAGPLTARDSAYWESLNRQISGNLPYDPEWQNGIAAGEDIKNFILFKLDKFNSDLFLAIPREMITTKFEILITADLYIRLSERRGRVDLP